MGKPPQITIDPQTRALQQQAVEDRDTAIQDRVSQQTRDLLIQFGRRKAFAGASLPGFGSLTQGL